MSKHTPGPWTYCMTDGTNYARITCDQTGGDNLRGYCGEANARLIAAAPDLLAALEKCEALALSDNDPEDLLEEVRIAAHSAIALAKGKA